MNQGMNSHVVKKMIIAALEALVDAIACEVAQCTGTGFDNWRWEAGVGIR